MVTHGYCLPSKFVVHVVGPCLAPNASPTDSDAKFLTQCYYSILEAVESLPASLDGQKSVALCGISTGLFSFPVEQAAGVAICAVEDWLKRHPSTTITDIIFNTFTEAEDTVYRGLLNPVPETWFSADPASVPPTIYCDSLAKARAWLRSADTVIVSAGAGFSAADGLDYNSQALFAKNFPGFLKYGFQTLYSVFGFTDWSTEEDRWGYFFTHLNMVKQWPKSPLYETLIRWLKRFGPQAHVRTSNADGLFLSNGWPAEQLSTPQGSYAFLQCLQNCTPDSTALSEPYLSHGVPVLDPVTQRLLNPEFIPICRYCFGKMNICVRAGSWFNSSPFEAAESRWRAFRGSVLNEGQRTIVLEVGVGMSTPGVLRWPNENLVRCGNGNVKMIRLGLGHESAVPRDLDENGLALSIDGDIASVIQSLLR
ncbi:Protein ADP-ribosyltransferase [Paramyrothecium foliicola]|nr:Protein ADP-ribosyltransferase [Paramyrothecium foliicola]